MYGMLATTLLILYSLQKRRGKNRQNYSLTCFFFWGGGGGKIRSNALREHKLRVFQNKVLRALCRS
jgi:hypothetical protein